jgi:chaperonin cofactor prefoldin
MSDDPVNHPSHYTFGKYEVIDVLEDWFHDDPLLWQVGKYIARAKHKGKLVEDLEKARFYLNRRITEATKQFNNDYKEYVEELENNG